MKPIKLLLAVLPNTSWDDPEMEGQKYLFLMLFMLQMAAVAGVCFSALDTWQSQGWTAFLPLILLSISTLTFVLFVRNRWPLKQRLGQKALRLRAMAEGEHDQLAPLAAEQPAPLPAEEHPASAMTLGPLWRRKISMRVSIILEIILGITFISLPIGVFLFTIIRMFPILHTTFAIWATVIFAIVMACIMIPLAYIGVELLRLARHTLLSAYVLIDEQGLHWSHLATTKSSRINSLDWQQARSFFMIAAAEPGTDKWLKGYALDAHSLLLTWQLSHRSSAQERAASDMLCRLVVTRTKLPLRDLSAAVEKLVSIDEPSGDEQQPVLAVSQAQGAEDE